MDESPHLQPEEKNFSNKNAAGEHQLSFMDEFEDICLESIYPWAKSCIKIKRVMRAFLKSVEKNNRFVLKNI